MQPDNLSLWNSLGKTDPKHTKPFKRAGGFSGTALKPQWAIKHLTEQFGPCGIGWGVGEPSFQMATADKETLVYCTVSAWHGDKANVLWGVGGDKVASARKDGSVFVDDEAFKKAFTDAVMNAFKFVGVGADIHMGLFDDSKYLSEVRQEFAERTDPPVTEDQLIRLQNAADDVQADLQAFCKFMGVTSLKTIPQSRFDEAMTALSKKKKAAA